MSRIWPDRVMQTTTSTGTGNITPSGTIPGFESFSTWMADGDTFDYVIYAVDSAGAPTGEWETGVGTWNAGVIERTDFYNSSTGSAVSFSAGTKYVAVTISAYSFEEAMLGAALYTFGLTSETLLNYHNNSFLMFTNASAKTLTVETEATGAYWYGTLCFLYNSGAGDLTVVGGSGVTITGAVAIPQYGGAILHRFSDTLWTLLPILPPRQRGAVVKKSADQTAADYSTATAVAWTAEISDTDAIHDNATNNTRLTVPSGVTRVRLKFNFELANVTADTWVTAKMRKNAAAFDGQGAQSVETGNTTVHLNAESAVVTVTGGDYFDVTLQAEDTSIDVVAAGSWFSMEIVL